MLAELILGGIVVFLTIKGIQALERFVMRSKSPLVNGTVIVTLSWTSKAASFAPEPRA